MKKESQTLYVSVEDVNSQMYFSVSILRNPVGPAQEVSQDVHVPLLKHRLAEDLPQGEHHVLGMLRVDVWPMSTRVS